MKPERVRLFIKPWCGWCQEAREWLESRGIAYERVDVTANPKDWDEMVQLSGQTRAPVIQVDDEVLADFDVDQLSEFWAARTVKDQEA
jgi:glutaredoxin